MLTTQKWYDLRQNVVKCESDLRSNAFLAVVKITPERITVRDDLCDIDAVRYRLVVIPSCVKVVTSL